jgi:hypothetical protein
MPGAVDPTISPGWYGWNVLASFALTRTEGTRKEVPGTSSALLVALASASTYHKSSHVWASSQKGRRGEFDPEAFDEQQVKFANPAPRLKRLLAYLALRT